MVWIYGIWEFPDDPVIKKLPYNAGDVSSIPGLGTEISYDAKQLSPCAATTEPTHHN